LQGWVAAGLPPDQFWHTTPAEMEAMQAGAMDRIRHDLRIQQGLAYTQAVLVGTAVHAPKKLQPFKKVFPDQRDSKPQTGEQMLAALRSWSKGLQAAGMPKG
jgi:hypothetical protein